MNLLLDALGGNVKPAGRDKWLARCPVHNDRHFAMGIMLASNGKILIRCNGCEATGLDVYEVLGLRNKEGMKELNGGDDFTPDPNYVRQEIRDNLREDRVFMKMYNKSVARGDKILWEDQKRKKLAVARIAGIEAKWGNI